MSKQLVSFGNYLLKRYGVMEHSTDGKNTPLFQRQISDADLRNWKNSEKDIHILNELPSRYQINDTVAIKFGAFRVEEAKVIMIHFTESKIFYDLEIKISFEGTLEHPPGYTTTRIYKVDSNLVEDL